MTDAIVDLDKIITEIFCDAPKLALERMLREKLTAAGVKARPSSISKVADQILSGAEGELSFGEKAADAADILITQEDIDKVIERVEAVARDDLPKIISAASDKAADQLYGDLKKTWVTEHRQQKKDMTKFRKNLETRYGEGLDKLRMLVTISREWGQDNYRSKYLKSRGNLSHLDDVLIKLHVRACQVTSEIIVLLENDLADGAMARWRTLHEITTVGLFITAHGEELAERYVHYQFVESKKAMNAYAECRKELGYRAYSKKRAAAITKKCAGVIAKYGKPFDNEYGWAAHLVGRGKDKYVKFADLQREAGMPEMRAYYQMASYNVHASPKGVYFKLGQIERSATLLAGSSNAELVEPGQNAALSLAKLTMTVCNDREAPPFDNIVYMKVVNRLMWEIPQDLARADRTLKRDYRRLKKA